MPLQPIKKAKTTRPRPTTSTAGPIILRVTIPTPSRTDVAQPSHDPDAFLLPVKEVCRRSWASVRTELEACKTIEARDQYCDNIEADCQAAILSLVYAAGLGGTSWNIDKPLASNQVSRESMLKCTNGVKSKNGRPSLANYPSLILEKRERPTLPVSNPKVTPSSKR